jgi:hypothetical protein
MVDTNSDRNVDIELKSLTYRSIFIFGVYLPADGLIDNYRQELNALDDLHTYYINYCNVIVAGDLKASCINKNLKLTNSIIIVQTDSLSVVHLLTFIKLYEMS